MNNIDILEEKIKNVKKYNAYNYPWTEKDIEAIETLIAENKELKEEKEIDYTTVYLSGVYNERKKWREKVEELLKEIQEEEKIAYKNFMNKKLEENFEVDGAILQELGYIEGKLQSLLGKE